jgi:hypothetical protein
LAEEADPLTGETGGIITAGGEFQRFLKDEVRAIRVIGVTRNVSVRLMTTLSAESP